MHHSEVIYTNATMDHSRHLVTFNKQIPTEKSMNVPLSKTCKFERICLNILWLPQFRTKKQMCYLQVRSTNVQWVDNLWAHTRIIYLILFIRIGDDDALSNFLRQGNDLFVKAMELKMNVISFMHFCERLRKILSSEIKYRYLFVLVFLTTTRYIWLS